MHLRNGEHGYGVVTKSLHWAVVTLVAAQFALGLALDDGDADDACEVLSAAGLQVTVQRLADDSAAERREEQREQQQEVREERREEQQERREERCEERADAAEDSGGPLLPWHVAVGLTILALGVLRVVWRRMGSLPPWAPQLTERQRSLLHASEVALMTSTFAVPLTGLLLVLVSDDWVWLHVVAQLGFLAAIAAHVTLVLSRRLLPRMLPGHRSAAPPT